MRKISRLLTFALSAAMIFSLSGCKEEADNELTPFELYQQAYEKLLAHDSIEYDIAGYLDMSGAALADALGDSMDAVSLVIDGNVKQIKVSDDTYDVMADMNMGVPFVDIDASMQMYMTDDNLYLNLPDFDMKYKMPLSMIKNDAADNADNALWAEPITEDMLKESSVSQNGKTIKLTLDGSKLNEEMADEAAAAEQPVIVTVEDIPMTVNLDDNGEITSYTIDFDMQVTEGDLSIDLNMDATVDIAATDNVNISFPQDLDSYTEMDIMAIAAE